MARVPPGTEVVAAADRVEPSLLCLARLLEQLGRREPFVPQRYPVRDLLRLTLAGPEKAADGLDHAHRVEALPTAR